MRKYSKNQLEHFLQSDILNDTLNALDDKFTRHAMKAETHEQSKPWWDLWKALQQLRTELKAIKHE